MPILRRAGLMRARELHITWENDNTLKIETEPARKPACSASGPRKPLRRNRRGRAIPSRNGSPPNPGGCVDAFRYPIRSAPYSRCKDAVVFEDSRSNSGMVTTLRSPERTPPGLGGLPLRDGIALPRRFLPERFCAGPDAETGGFWRARRSLDLPRCCRSPR